MQPSREEIYIDTRTQKDGSIVTEKAATVIIRILTFISILSLCLCFVLLNFLIEGYGVRRSN